MMPNPKLYRHRRTSPIDDFLRRVEDCPEMPAVISEGDSWFHYPLSDNIMDHIDALGVFNLLRLETSGDEILNILAGKQKRQLRQLLSSAPVRCLLFSGGGNDIVGPDLLPLLRTQQPGMTWRDCIIDHRLARRLEQVKLAYLDLIDTRDDNCATCAIITHGYDYPIPSDIGAQLGPIKVAGPWMKPYMVSRKVVSQDDQNNIARFIISAFNDMLSGLAAQHDNFHYLATPGTLNQHDWKDEIHPNTRGFKKITQHFETALREILPDAFA